MYEKKYSYTFKLAQELMGLEHYSSPNNIYVCLDFLFIYFYGMCVWISSMVSRLFISQAQIQKGPTKVFIFKYSSFKKNSP